MKFPTLYKTLQQERQWTIWTKGDHIYESYGVVGGKLTDPKDGKECKATNVGRSNERSAEEQAVFEAESKWRGKVAKGYEARCEKGIKMMKEVQKHKATVGSNSKAGKTRDTNKLYIAEKLPKHHNTQIMKGPEYKGKHDVSTGGFVQPKYDGVRCKASTDGKMGILTSSGFNQLPHLKHIKDAICEELVRYEEEFGEKLLLDGELYAHSIVDDGVTVTDDVFNKYITSACRATRSTPHPLEEQITFVIFDVHNDKPQSERIDTLKAFFEGVTHKCLVMAPTFYVKSAEKMEKYMDKFTGDRYEGLIFRYSDRLYVDKKKTGLDAPVFKYKKMKDDEFLVVGCKQGRGSAKDRVIWQCETADGTKFDAAQTGTTEACSKMFKNKEKYIGKMLTVKFQDYTKSGTPRFPIAKAFRDYE